MIVTTGARGFARWGSTRAKTTRTDPITHTDERMDGIAVRTRDISVSTDTLRIGNPKQISNQLVLGIQSGC